MPLFRLGRKQLVVGGLMLGAVITAPAWITYEIHRPLSHGQEPATLRISDGVALAQVTAELQERGWISPAAELGLQAYGRFTGLAAELKRGAYQVPQGMSAYELLSRIADGEVIQHHVTIVEGWTFAQMLDAVQSHEATEVTLEGVPQERIPEVLGIGAEHPEGLFYPSTYNFSRGATDREILRTAHREMQQSLQEAWKSRQMGLPLDSPYEALILASIIEKETAHDGERRKISGVLQRRLRRGMRLRADPTVLYGLGEGRKAGGLTHSELRTDTPYNTYMHHGLPPTPIALPSAASLHAAVDPEPGEALYFVARGDGTHYFSESLKEHNAAIERYREGGSEE